MNTQQVQVDSTPPSTSAGCGGATCDGWFGASGTDVVLAAADSGLGVAAIYYTTDGSSPDANSAVYNAPIPVTSTTTIEFRAVDNAGNLEQVESQQVEIDNTSPVSSISCDGGTCSSGWIGAGVTVTLGATDAGGAGVQAIYYTTDGSDPTAISPTYNGPFTVAAPTTIKFRAVDAAGNLEPVNSQLLQVDSAPPSTSISCDGGSCSGFFTAPGASVMLAATNGGSGVQAIYYTTDGTDPTTAAPPTTGRSRSRRPRP